MYKSHKLLNFVRISFCLCLQRVYTNIMNLTSLTMATGIRYAYSMISTYHSLSLPIIASRKNSPAL